MAFTEAQRVKIRSYMGWSGRFHQSETARLEQAMNAVEDKADTVTLIEGTLSDLDDIVTAIKDAYNRLKAMKVGSIELPGHNEIGMLRSEGRRNVGILASTLGVEVRHDVFSAGSYRFFESWDGLNIAGSNIMLQG